MLSDGNDINKKSTQSRKQLISVYLYPFRRTSLFCSQKSSIFKVIDVDTINKHVTIASYDNIAKFRQKTRSFNVILPGPSSFFT